MATFSSVFHQQLVYLFDSLTRPYHIKRVT